MKKSLLTILILIAVIVGIAFLFSTEPSGPPVGSDTATSSEPGVKPIGHATFVFNWDGSTIYFDPVGGAETFSSYQSPDAVFITHTHPDHFDKATLNGVVTSSTELIVPQTVANQLPDSFSGQVTVINNGEMTSWSEFGVKAIPMYNLPTSTDAYHVKGDGNGYLLEKSGYRVYVAGDTSGTEEMRNLDDIDMAFVPMNLPYTMDVQEAANAVAEFSPDVVYPYHYRNKDDSLSDVNKFKDLVESKSDGVEVRLRDWYPNSS